MDWKSANTNDSGLVKIPESWLHLHYYEALNILFRFENSLRVFVYIILKNEHLEEWKACSFEIDEKQKSIKGIASSRIKQAANFGYLGFEVKSPLMHLTSGELTELIVSDAYWPKFSTYFKGNRDIIKNKLLEIGTVRNSLAHFRPIKPEDLELIKQNTRHTLIGVEECLKNIYNFPVRVPTNTDSDWYKSLASLGNEFITVTPFYSPNEKWVNAKLTFKSPELNKITYGVNYHSFTVGKINPANLFSNNIEFSKYAIYASEYIPQPALVEDYHIEATTNINVIFNRKRLEADYALIVEEFRKLFLTTLEECELLSQDHLARGKIISSCSVTTWVTGEGEQAKWNYGYDNLKQEYSPDHPDEYWGEQQWGMSDVVSGITQYPWMPSEISKSEFPF